jgi:hypothetical protein
VIVKGNGEPVTTVDGHFVNINSNGEKLAILVLLLTVRFTAVDVAVIAVVKCSLWQKQFISFSP